jgi:hypothetical protein
MEVTTLIEAALVWIAIIVLCIVSPRARLIVGGVLLVVGVLFELMAPRDCDCHDWPPPWRRRRF